MAISKWPAVYGKAEKLTNLNWTRKSDGQCIIFLRSTAVGGLGHVGWAFQLDDGQFCFGGTENVWQSGMNVFQAFASAAHQGTTAQGGDNQAWDMIRYDDQMFKIMGRDMQYDKYKILTVQKPSVAKAWNQVLWNNKCGFSGVMNNCLDATNRVLTGYGAVPPPPWIPSNYAPAWYFKNAKGTSMMTPK